MSAVVPTFLIPKKLKYYVTSKESASYLVESFITMLSAKKMADDEVLSVALSLLGQMTQVDMSKFFFELCREPETIHLNRKQIEEFKDEFIPPKLDDVSRLLNCAFCLLTIGKKIEIQYCTTWMIARAKAIYSILNIEWSDNALDKVIAPEKLKVLSDAFNRAQRMRCAICIFIIHMSKSMTCEQPIYRYVTDMLQYSQLVGFYLIYYILVCDTAHPIMKDPYLTMDTMRFIEAYNMWDQYPRCYRKFMGLMADRETLSVMGGNPLRRLTYIAIQLAARRDPSIKNLKFVVPQDSDKLDNLIKKHFPETATNLNTINLERMIMPMVATSAAKKHLVEVVKSTGSCIVQNAFEDAIGREVAEDQAQDGSKQPINIRFSQQPDSEQKVIEISEEKPEDDNQEDEV